MSQTVTNETVQVEYVDDYKRTTNVAVMVEYDLMAITSIAVQIEYLEETGRKGLTLLGVR